MVSSLPKALAMGTGVSNLSMKWLQGLGVFLHGGDNVAQKVVQKAVGIEREILQLNLRRHQLARLRVETPIDD